ncbi:hypothetical protein V3851_15605 [Paenibacillus sp. M1]|uniref:Uncharacterized protein n=1 Tax=Paenibacillus haidiansis TaxID=1574488 RepID=A0ABU7VVH3_9BACL
MQNNAKSLLWLCTAISLCLGAVFLTLDLLARHDQALRSLIPFLQNQKRSLTDLAESGQGWGSGATGSVGAPGEGWAVTDGSGRFSGLEILYGLRNWEAEGATVSIDGTVIPFDDGLSTDPGGEQFDRDLRFALSLLDLRGQYTADTSFDMEGTLTSLDFHSD